MFVMKPQTFESLVEVATAPYAPAGQYARRFSRGKLLHDPAFRAVLARGVLPDPLRLLDLGCGLGVLSALLAAARTEHAAGRWIDGWPAPPREHSLHGIELLDWKVRSGRIGLGTRARIEQGDIRTAPLPRCNVAVILDVLLYLPGAEQQAVLARVAEAIEPGGLLILREADTAGGWRFHATRWAEQLYCLARGQGWVPLHYRSAAQWQSALQTLGFSVEALPMSDGTPFANVMYLARKRS